MRSWQEPARSPLPGRLASLEIFDTMSGSRQALPVQGEASLYVCGITPYDATHMGHAATYLTFDLLGRAWRDAGVTVRYVQNVTDVDDPLLERAERDGVDWRELAASQTDLFRADMEALRVLPPQHYIGAVEAIEWIVPEVERLVAEGLAYSVPGGDIYFDAMAASSGRSDAFSLSLLTGAWWPVLLSEAWWLGQVSGLSEAEMLPLFAERGGDPDREGKRNPLDPLLWRTAREGEPHWPGGSLGAGRPGWHIECTVISRRFLPAPFTVQGGGSDLIFPHHEMSAGHAWGLSGKQMASYYAHTGMVGLDGEKMSKSKGNLVLVSALRAAGVEPAAIRLAVLANHYRSDWFWTDELLSNAQERLQSWRTALQTVQAETALPLLAELRAALGNDLDAPAALLALDRWAAASRQAKQHSASDAELVRRAVDSLLGVSL
ncbi:cysteine--1-D-myo-inosityl 2-amino-2-deoxy-alpha-D-glucopyranoside ligase [Psychromicrobium lacuslunae]|uniref:L-cysteine:1D-myo-inositol 2-amino-2-deoxy-alpha-D-glucopyranoside ligase n=1 Tax=Psychromicrobium lacuslunae TaxID=1618207 RepID=A0A0D4BXR6_9MICC|nr:cysteine--1-D-myo-inosityl 2-amino-2-deoxy-alpha-D-glucopyranoside ligase [Psychromicrobium lacuslunae]AJT40925.1 L-cysteine:1D-myo-inositol 2-amino-2-deoxy-alpha-D-glucopyranoside ligase [Psychromicrobium lacuslunae]